MEKNIVYESLENVYDKIQEFLISHQFGPEHSKLIADQEKLSELLDVLDLEAIKNHSDDLNKLHQDFEKIKEASDEVIDELNKATDYIKTATKITKGLDSIITMIRKIM